MGALQKTAKVDSWIERLPAGMQAEWDRSIVYRAAVHMHQERGMPVGMAIASALNWARAIVRTGDVKQWPGPQQVRPSSVAECAAALALWERMKATAHAIKTSHARSDMTTLALAGVFDPAKHPRAPAGSPTGGKFTAGPARDSEAAKAQQDGKATDNYNKTIGAKDAKAQIGGMSNEDLIALSKAAYSFKSSDPKVVALRVAIANEVAKRGGNVNDYGGLGKKSPGGPKPLTGGPAKSAAAKKNAAPKKPKAAPKPKTAKAKAPAKPKAAPKVKKPAAKPVSASVKGGKTVTKAPSKAAVPLRSVPRASLLRASHCDGFALAAGANSSQDGPKVTYNAAQRAAVKARLKRMTPTQRAKVRGMAGGKTGAGC